MTPEIDVITPRGTGVYKEKCPTKCPDCNHKTEEAKKRAEEAYRQYKTLMSGVVKNIIDARMMGVKQLPGLSDARRAKGCMIAAEQHPKAYVIRSPVLDESIGDDGGYEPTKDERAKLTDQDVQMGMFVHTVPEDTKGCDGMKLYHPGKF